MMDRRPGQQNDIDQLRRLGEENRVLREQLHRQEEETRRLLAESRQAGQALTEQRQSREFLSTSALYFLEEVSADRLFLYMGKQLRGISGKAIVAVTSYDMRTNQTVVQAVEGPEGKLKKMKMLLAGRNPVGMGFTVAVGTFNRMQRGTMALVEGGLCDLLFYQLPTWLCRLGEIVMRLGPIYAMPIVLENDILGTVAVMTDRKEVLHTRSVMEQFVNQAALALKRIRAEEEQRRLLDEVERRVAELDATFDSIADGMIIYDTSVRVVRSNAAAERIIGFRPEVIGSEILGSTGIRLEKPDGTLFTEEETPVLRALNGVTSFGTIVVLRKPGEVHWGSVSAAPIRTPEGTIRGAVVTFTDITQQHNLQEQMRILLHSVSHDLRSPLAVIQGHIQLMQSYLDERQLDGMLQPSMAAVLRSVQRINMMIQDLVDAARFEGGQLQLALQPVKLPAFIADILERMRTIMEVERILVELPPDLPPVSADYNRLERILLNLLSNALKYSAPGTPVLVRARSTEGMVEVSVADRGVGIAPDDLPYIFERFYRAEEARKTEGVGLGLYITRQLVEAHGGRIRVESRPGVGSTFYFMLPIAAEE